MAAKRSGKLANLGSRKAAPFRAGGKRRTAVVPQKTKRANGAGKRGAGHRSA